MINIVLGTVVLKEPVIGLYTIVMALSWFEASRPGKVHGFCVFDEAAVVDLFDDFLSVLGGVHINYVEQPSFAELRSLYWTPLGEEGLSVDGGIPLGEYIVGRLVGKNRELLLLVIQRLG